MKTLKKRTCCPPRQISGKLKTSGWSSEKGRNWCDPLRTVGVLDNVAGGNWLLLQGSQVVF